MNIDFELYRIFYTVANYNNITKASEELHISQPAISKSIKKLESLLGGELFTRTKRGVILTEEGKEFYNYIRQAIEYINNAESKFTELVNLETGIIKIGISVTLTQNFLLPYLETFHRLYPNIDIQIITNAGNELINKLRNGLIDLIILNIPNNIDKDIKIIECKKVSDIFVVGSNYKELANKKIKLDELNNYPLILQTKNSNTRSILDNFCEKNNVVLKPNIELASYTLVKEFTKINMGIGYLVKEFIKDDLNKSLYELNVYPKIPPRSIGIAVSKNHIPNFSTRKLIEIITKK